MKGPQFKLLWIDGIGSRDSFRSEYAINRDWIVQLAERDLQESVRNHRTQIHSYVQKFCGDRLTFDAFVLPEAADPTNLF
jgi:hypothetical protein